ncbi:unnamed protein product [Ectocarpus sp. 12 AP-2014]
MALSNHLQCSLSATFSFHEEERGERLMMLPFDKRLKETQARIVLHANAIHTNDRSVHVLVPQAGKGRTLARTQDNHARAGHFHCEPFKRMDRSIQRPRRSRPRTARVY